MDHSMSKKIFCSLSKPHAFKGVWAKQKQNGSLRGTDEELMLSFRNGDEIAFEILYRRYKKPLFNFLCRMVINATDAESEKQSKRTILSWSDSTLSFVLNGGTDMSRLMDIVQSLNITDGQNHGHYK